MFQGMTGNEILGAIVFYLILCGIVALIASGRGKSPGNAFGLSLLLSPLVGFLVTVLSGPSEKRGPCWQCKEQVVVGALKCRHCGAELTWPEAKA